MSNGRDSNVGRVQQTLAANAGDARAILDQLESLAGPLGRAADLIQNALLGGSKLLCCGNGGSAADCAHLTAEIAARYKLDRRGYAAIDLTANHSLTTALINDFPPVELFCRQIEAIGSRGDVLMAFSTTGRSENIRLALQAARQSKLHTIAMLGGDGGPCRDAADITLIVPSTTTARIQEMHLLLYHTICEVIDPALAAG